MTRPYYLPYARIDWQEAGTPAAPAYQDIYWSTGQGLFEKQHVFIDGNDLPARFEVLGRSHFTLCEIGFGFGLNSLLTANAFSQHAGDGAILNYIAFENAPVSPADLTRALSSLTLPTGIDRHAFERHRQCLQDAWPMPSPGYHCRWIDERICLTLILGDVNEALPELDAEVDAWFLDGFSPRANPEAWQTRLFGAMAERSRGGATASTYSVASAVRHGLGEAGFDVTKVAGFGRKAEMTRARAPGNWRPAALGSPRVAIVGAGLAGLACTAALARRGIEAHLFEARDAPAQGASGIPGLAVYPHLSVDPGPKSLFSLSAFGYALQTIEDIHPTGRCQLAHTTREDGRLRKIAAALPDAFARYVSADELGELTGLPPQYPGMYLPGAGWRVASDTRAIGPCRFGSSVQDIRPDSLVLGDGYVFDFDFVIIATGHTPLAPTRPLPTMPVRGQSIAIESSRALGPVVGGPASLIPAGGGRLLVGGTYANEDDDMAPRESDSKTLAAAAARLLGHEVEVSAAFTGIRCASRDRFPIAGRVPDWLALDDGHIAYDARTLVITGLGSHGATTSPLLGEYLARLVTGESACLPPAVRACLDPARFTRRG